MNYLNKFWDKITNNGVDEAVLGREIVKIRLLNQLIFITFITSIFALIIYFTTDESVEFLLVTLANMLLEGSAITAAYYQKHHITRFLSCWIFPTLMAGHTLVLGGNFGEVSGFTAFALINFIIYEDKKHIQIPLVIYTCLLFIASKIYVIQYAIKPIAEENPYAEIMTFIVVVIILGLIMMLYLKSLSKFEAEQAVLIQNLEQKNGELQAVNTELEQFTYIASHDLKTPLRTINSHVGLAKRHLKREDYEAIEIDLSFISQGAKQMYALVSDILEYKKVSNEKETYETLDLNEIVHNVLSSLEIFVTERNAEVITYPLPTIYGRKRDFTILFQNFIENGIKYNESKFPKVQLNIENTEDNFILVIRDDGIGIAPEYHQKIFQFFKRLHTQEKYQGTGIGLGLCKKIIHTYKGVISVDSSEGKGTTFKIALPKNIIIQASENESIKSNMV
ncbi:MAG: ATP-binding protein [Saprospiraceae bacterium]